MVVRHQYVGRLWIVHFPAKKCMRRKNPEDEPVILNKKDLISDLRKVLRHPALNPNRALFAIVLRTWLKTKPGTPEYILLADMLSTTWGSKRAPRYADDGDPPIPAMTQLEKEQAEVIQAAFGHLRGAVATMDIEGLDKSGGTDAASTNTSESN